MKTPRSLYNNEMICAISIYSVLKHLKTISVSKALLIFPLVSHKGTLDFLKNKNTKIRSLEEFIIKKPDYFSNYNDRYYSFLVLSMNSLILLSEMGLIRIDESQISIVTDEKFDINNNIMGERAYNFFNVSSKLADILKSDDKNLYLQLRVQL
ncbi:MAG: hypothetical protein KKF57_08195 [Firmicutes bacterium]|nr:hypothetical protein [Bacillota bacterium]